MLGDAGYRLAVDPETVDVVDFERRVVAARMAARTGQTEQALADAAAALDAWQGEPLAGLAGPWFAAARQRLTDGRANAVETWASCRLDLGHPEAALDVLSRQVVTHPRRERSWELLMLALHGSGRTADALDTYRQARDRLVEQTGLEPSPQLRALHERLLRDDAGWAAAGPPMPPPVAFQPAPFQNAPPQPAPWQPARPPTPSLGGAPSRPPRATRLAVLGAKLLGTALPLVSFGMLTWVVIGMFALLRRSLPLAVSAAGYFALTVVTFVLLGGDRPEADPMTDVGAALALLVAFGGSLQAAALAFGLFGRARAPG